MTSPPRRTAPARVSRWRAAGRAHSQAHRGNRRGRKALIGIRAW